MERTGEIGLEMVSLDPLQWFLVANDRVARLSQEMARGFYSLSLLLTDSPAHSLTQALT